MTWAQGSPLERVRKRLKPRWEELALIAEDCDLSVYAAKRALRSMEVAEMAERRQTTDGRAQWRRTVPQQR